MNRVMLTGRLTRDPILEATKNGTSICQFNIATNRPIIRDGKREVDFINCIVWGKSAENLCKYQEKGSQIALNGRIQTRTYDDAKGNKQYITEVVAESIEFLGSKKEQKEETANPFEEFGNNLKTEAKLEEIKIEDSDLPF